MENAVLSTRVVVVKDPTALPEGTKHHEAIDTLAKLHKAVVLLSHGNKYKLPPGYILPANVTLLQYDLDMQSIQKCVIRLREILRQYGISIYSRHLDDEDPMPILLSGACLTMNSGTELAFVNRPDNYIEAKERPQNIPTDSMHAWDLL